MMILLNLLQILIPERIWDISHWFADRTEYDAFSTDFRLRRVTELRWMSCQYFTSEGFHFHELLEAQGLKQFVELNNSFCPDLALEFVCNMKVTTGGLS